MTFAEEYSGDKPILSPAEIGADDTLQAVIMDEGRSVETDYGKTYEFDARVGEENDIPLRVSENGEASTREAEENEEVRLMTQSRQILDVLKVVAEESETLVGLEITVTSNGADGVDRRYQVTTPSTNTD